MNATSPETNDKRCSGTSCADDARELAAILASPSAAKTLEFLHFSGAPVGFNQISRSLGVSRKELSRQLKKLHDLELVTKTQFGEKPPIRAEYAITRSGHELLIALEYLAKSAAQKDVGTNEKGKNVTDATKLLP